MQLVVQAQQLVFAFDSYTEPGAKPEELFAQPDSTELGLAAARD
jgi:hypothetical protein